MLHSDRIIEDILEFVERERSEEDERIGEHVEVAVKSRR